MSSNISIILNTAKNRLRYLDTTFNSLYKTIPKTISLFIMADVPHERLVQYITTNKTIKLDDSDSLYPNDLTDWQNKIGFIENKTEVRGVYKQYTHAYFNEELHVYEYINYVCRDVIKKVQCDYIVFIEDDVIFKQNWFEDLQVLIKSKLLEQVGYLSLFCYYPYAGDLQVKEHFTLFNTGTVAMSCFVINVKHFLSSIDKDYTYNINRDFFSLKSVQQTRFTREEIIKLPHSKRNSLYNRGRDKWLINNLRKTSYTGFLNTGICQHIGIESSIYSNVRPDQINNIILERSFYNQTMLLERVDKNISPPFVL